MYLKSSETRVRGQDTTVSFWIRVCSKPKESMWSGCIGKSPGAAAVGYEARHRVGVAALNGEERRSST